MHKSIINDIASGNTLIGSGVPFDSVFFRQTMHACWALKKSGGINLAWASGGPSHTHQFIASNGILILSYDQGNAIIEHLYEDNGADIIMEYADKPDVDETDMPFINAGHFYNPAKGTNYWGKTSPTANQRFCVHYGAAVYNYSSNKKFAWQELGRAIHYLSDLNVPHHASNRTPLDSNHSVYEKWVDANRFNYIITSCPNEVYKYCMDNSIWVIGHKMAVNANSNIQYALQSDEKSMHIAATNTLKEAQKFTAGIYLKFLKEVREV
ncbi:MAG: Phospholipase C precursor [Pelotomaculum sp. PtaB.Bin104]|nr:MAG: Phospholipase C precursor [Pelotomaculum sp. PtaB.Bin104]